MFVLVHYQHLVSVLLKNAINIIWQLLVKLVYFYQLERKPFKFTFGVCLGLSTHFYSIVEFLTMFLASFFLSHQTHHEFSMAYYSFTQFLFHVIEEIVVL